MRSRKLILIPLIMLVLILATGISPINYPKFQAFDSAGSFLVGGKLYTYKAGTSTAKTSYSNSTLSAANTNPVILDSRGEASIYGSGPYKLVLKTSSDATIWTIDNYVMPATGWNVYYAGDDLNSVVSLIGSSAATIIIDQSLTLSSSCNIPANISLMITPPGVVTIPNGYTLTVGGPFDAPRSRVFIDQNSGNNGVVLSATGEAYPEWWAVNTSPGTTDMTSAIQAALNSGAAVVKLGNTTYLSGALTWPVTGVRLSGYNRTDSVLTSSGASGSWLITYNDTTKAWRGNGIDNVTINIPTTGANGIKLLEARSVTLRDFNLVGTGGGAIGILLDDEASTSPQVGTAWNFIDNYNIIGFSDAGIRLDTQGAAVWCNRNHIGYGLIQTCGIGLDILNGDTNFVIGACPQNCTTGINLGDGGDYNVIQTVIEGCTNDIIISANAVRNMISGNWDDTKVTGTGSATTLMRSGRIKIPELTNDMTWESSSSNRSFVLASGSTGNMQFGVRDSSDVLTYGMSIIGNVAAPYVNIYNGMVFASLAAEPASKTAGLVVRANRTDWDPCSIGSGGSYFCWWNGSAWRLLDQQ